MFNGNYCSVGTKTASNRNRISRSAKSGAKTRPAALRSVVGRSSKAKITRRKSRRTELTKNVKPAGKPVELEIKVETAFQPSIVSKPADRKSVV